MGKIGSVIVGVILGAAAMYGALMYHVVRAEDGVHFVPKTAAGFEDVYVDIRQFAISDWDEHRSLASALLKADKGNLMQNAATNQLRQSFDQIFDGVAPDSN